MQVKLMTSRAAIINGKLKINKSGDVIEVEPAEAKRMMESGNAVPVATEPPAAPKPQRRTRKKITK